MTEYQIYDLLASSSDNLTALTAVFFTILSAYVVAAYAVGPALSRTQLNLVNVLYLVATLGNLNLQTVAFQKLLRFSSMLPEDDRINNPSWLPHEVGLGIYMLIFLSMIFAGLYFMWSTRRNHVL